jgi:hypothetical protein
LLSNAPKLLAGNGIYPRTRPEATDRRRALVGLVSLLLSNLNSLVSIRIVKRIKKYDFESINAILKKFLVQFSEIMSVKEDFSNP